MTSDKGPSDHKRLEGTVGSLGHKKNMGLFHWVVRDDSLTSLLVLRDDN